MAANPQGRLVTAEDLVDVAARASCELVEGVVVEMGPTSGEHGEFKAELAGELRQFVRSRGLGKVYAGEVGFILARDPDTVRGADVAFLSAEKAGRVPAEGFVPFAPDLVVEIVSPGDRWTDIRRKVDEWLGAGTRLVWVVDPSRGAIEVYSPEEQFSLTGDATLSGGKVLPGFSMSLAQLFGRSLPLVPGQSGS